MSTHHLDSDQENALANAYAVQREAREVFGGQRQDLKAIEECLEYSEAAAELSQKTSRLGRAITQRLAHDPRHVRGAIEEEAADVALTMFGMFPAESEFWTWLREKTERLAGKIAEAKGG